VVCANLATDLLLGSKDRILEHVRPSGRLIISGVLASEFPGVRANYVRSGLRLTANIEEDGWRSGCFVRPG
jgi:ribosomal protein L11 methylase PrmA